MSETQGNAASSTPAVAVHRQRRWPKILLLVLVFLSGIAVGIGVTVIVAVKNVQHSIQHPELQPGRWTERLSLKLDLTPEETERVRAVLEEAFQRGQAIRSRSYPEVVRELDRLEEEVAQVLSPDKDERWRGHFQKLRRDWMPPPPTGGQSAPTGAQSP